MTEERRCGTCIYRDIPCRDAVGLCKDYSKWQPIAQEKGTMEKIQYTQQEWASIIDDLGWNPDVMEELKQKGYIRKSAVEEAEEMYNTIMHGNTVPTWDQLDRIITKYREAVQELKSEIARLKG